jgi:hypothetical protein
LNNQYFKTKFSTVHSKKPAQKNYGPTAYLRSTPAPQDPSITWAGILLALVGLVYLSREKKENFTVDCLKRQQKSICPKAHLMQQRTSCTKPRSGPGPGRFSAHMGQWNGPINHVPSIQSDSCAGSSVEQHDWRMRVGTLAPTFNHRSLFSSVLHGAWVTVSEPKHRQPVSSTAASPLSGTRAHWWVDCCWPRPTDGRWQTTREPRGLEPLSVGPATRTWPDVEIHWECHLTYTWSGRCLMCFS